MRRRGFRCDLTVIGLDISAGILANVGAPVVVLAMHMLYHVEDLQAALERAVRVLAPGGTLIASTNARADKKELDDLWAVAAADALGVERGPRRISLSSRFALDDAPDMLRPYFADIQVLELPGTITVREPEPMIAHLASYRVWADAAGVQFDATLDRARRLLDDVIERDGAFRISCRGGILVCYTTE